jgi:4'-phosphopantetheinyl transferase
MSLHLYSTGYPDQLSPVVIQSLVDRLPAALGQKAMTYRRWQDVYGSLFGRHLLRMALQKAGCPGDLSELQVTSYGRPYLENGPDFNISHSGNRVVCILSRQGRVGIDLEETAPLDFSDFKMQFTATEWAAITGASVPLLAFYHYWTAKESLIKADGRGLGIALDSLEIGEGPAGGDGGSVVGDRLGISGDALTRLNGYDWFIRKLTLFPGYACHIACENPIGVVEAEEISPGMF